MSELPREFVPQAPVFITVACHERQPFLTEDAHKALLLGVMREMRATIPFAMLGYAILNDHFHWLIAPGQADDIPLLVQSVKLRFVRRAHPDAESDANFVFWEKRYRDHATRGEEEALHLLDYIHYNPVKHGLVKDPEHYSWSSFRSFLAKHGYPKGWGADAPPAGIEKLLSV